MGLNAINVSRPRLMRRFGGAQTNTGARDRGFLDLRPGDA